MERAVLLNESPVVKAEELGFSAAKTEVPVAVDADGGVAVDFSSGGIVLDEVERKLIEAALQASAWNRTRAAQLLGISKETLRYRMEKYELQSPA